MSLQRINIPELGMPVGPYVHAVVHNNVVHSSGFTAAGTAHQNSPIADQAEAVFDQLERLARHLGTDMDKLIKVTVFVTDLSDIASLRDRLLMLYGTHLPASSLIKVDQLFLPELKIEIEASFALA